MSFFKFYSSRVCLLARRERSIYESTQPIYDCVQRALLHSSRHGTECRTYWYKFLNSSCLPNLHQHCFVSSVRKNAAQLYSTSAKPHMTKSLMKWKKRKRKSKAQQVKEMETLQRDMVKLLSKRAIQVVRDKSVAQVARGEVVTHHTFSHLGMYAENDSQMFVGTSLSEDQHWNDKKQRDKIDGKRMDLSKSDNQPQAFLHPHKHLVTSPVKSLIKENQLHTQSGSLEKPFEDWNPLSQDRTSVSGDQYARQSIFDSMTFSSVFHDKTFKKGQVHRESSSDLDFEKAVKKLMDDLSSNFDLDSPKRDWDTSGNVVLDPVEKTAFIDTSESTDVIKTKEGPNLAYLPQTEDRLDSIRINQLVSPKAEPETQTKTSARLSYRYDANAEHFPTSPSIHSSRVAALPSVFIHEPLDILDNSTFSTEDTAIHLSSKKSVSKSSKKKSKAGTVASPASSGVDPAKSSPGVAYSGADLSESINYKEELREMFDKSVVEACCFTGCDLLAVRNLQYHATKSKLSSIHMFNILIHTLAKKGDIATIKSLFMLLRQQGLKPNLQTYAACLECMGRMEDLDVHVVENLLSDVENAGLELRDIARRCSYKVDEWDYVLKAIRRVYPDFVPNSLRFTSSYTNELLLGLNAPNEQPIELNQYAVDIKPEEMMKRAQHQLELERKGDVKVESIATAQLLKPKIREIRNNLLADWRKTLQQSFEQKLLLYEKSAQDNINMTLYPFLKLFPAEEYVNIVFKCLKNLLTVSSGYSPTLNMIKYDLGVAVNRRYNIALRIAGEQDKKMEVIYERYMEEFLDQDKQLDNHRLMWLRAMGQDPNTMNMDMSFRRWHGHIIRDIGKILLDMILYDLKVDANAFKKRSPKRLVPAFCTFSLISKLSNTSAELKLHPVAARLFAVDDSGYFTFSPGEVPMLCPPVPWISRHMGSLMLGSNALVRMRSTNGHVDPLKWVKDSRYSSVLDSLNTLSACAWTINKPILDLQIEIFNKKGNAKLKVAPPASELPPLPVIKQDLPAKEKAVLYKERLLLQQQRQDAHGLWCTDLYRLSIANKFRDETFWFPHSMDFRGRTYPLPPHFNHLGSDNVRAMLFFAKGKPLGEKGYDWLKIHLINLTGLKKRSSNAERLEYANSVMEDILDSADHPLTGRKWWQDSDEPWQTLACCMEIAKIERFEGNKEDYICHFPIHQDGSCNGLQHYAAMGRDQSGAESVNLYPFDVPKDVYSDVVELVEKVRKTHAEEGKEIAQALEGFIKRKVIKQTIMTTVYGVTRYGARAQILRQLKDIPKFPEDKAWQASIYLTHTTFSCLREMFEAAKDIQDWLTEAANQIAQFTSVDWVTPLGFPVMQPYFKQVGKHDSAAFNLYKPNVMKQKNAFPPNYVHSLDSTHMMLTSLYCVHAGITYVSVHDCYWTHACDVPIMNKICREQFVNMHKQPLLEDLSEHLVDLVKRANNDPSISDVMKRVDVPALMKLLQNVPKRGTFNLDNVLQSTYFFS